MHEIKSDFFFLLKNSLLWLMSLEGILEGLNTTFPKLLFLEAPVQRCTKSRYKTIITVQHSFPVATASQWRWSICAEAEGDETESLWRTHMTEETGNQSWVLEQVKISKLDSNDRWQSPTVTIMKPVRKSESDKVNYEESFQLCMLHLLIWTTTLLPSKEETSQEQAIGMSKPLSWSFMNPMKSKTEKEG